MITRKINWISSAESANWKEIELLETKLANFYANNPDYYGDIDFTANNWLDESEVGYQRIVETAKKSTAICEFGCGSSNMLKYYPELQSRYMGCDFSAELIRRNEEKYPDASFMTFKVPNQLPFSDAQFDFVFSVFVLEHSTRPGLLLDECRRILKPGGTLIILCPDFLGHQRISSQRSGWSEGTTSDKFKQKKYADALLTLWDNRVRIPILCRINRIKANKKPRFLINVSPIVFEDKFLPDVDAVYLTYKQELVSYLQKWFNIEQNDKQVVQYTTLKNLIYLSAVKK